MVCCHNIFQAHNARNGSTAMRERSQLVTFELSGRASTYKEANANIIATPHRWGPLTCSLSNSEIGRKIKNKSSMIEKIAPEKMM